ncbi:citrate synthase-like protein [Pelagophyceae sp. CCMP2097]|nr:citrate synthase-like protein [Pelagophyceae sp. CCMP2097]|mmetsp:Transcript_6831/g.22118  ORF Transcript_6831/g.22118 Transcript_6831/m.22118 type:complete len:1091 (-) Transcript_6831:171-3443(-)
MSAKPVREYYGKQLLAKYIKEYSGGEHDFESRGILVKSGVDDPTSRVTWDTLLQENEWAKDCKLVAKPDQLIKRRGKAGLIAINKTFDECKGWVNERMNKSWQVEQVEGVLNTFLIEPFVPHAQEDEYYICIVSNREGEEMLFYHEGGVDVGDVDAKAAKLQVGLTHDVSASEINSALLMHVPAARQAKLASFLVTLLKCYRELHFVYMEINPIVVDAAGKITPLDLAAKIDETASFLVQSKWGADIDFPAPFGRAEFPEEAYVKGMDAKTGASLKLTILNVTGRVWTMVAGGGASVVYADTICDLGFAHELANYGEYSGAPNDEQTFNYARTILGLMTRTKHPDGKVLIIGGGIANFTDVAATFKGLIKAIRLYADELLAGNVGIFVRRAGPNYQEGLKMMLKLKEDTGIRMKICGPEQDAVGVCPVALGLQPFDSIADFDPDSKPVNVVAKAEGPIDALAVPRTFDGDFTSDLTTMSKVQFSGETRCIVYGLQQVAVQGMLDFDYMCKRARPSVAAMVYPFQGNHYVKFYWGQEETLIPVYTKIDDAVAKHKDASVMVNFASFRSVYETCMETFDKHSAQITTMAIIAEGVPEMQTRLLVAAAEAKGVGIIGPATVGGIKPGCFRIGNTGGMLDNIVMSKLYRPGSVCYVSKSGGMSNELNNIISRNSDGVCEGVAIGGDRYPGSRFIDHLLRYNDNDDCKMLVLLGEVGGTDEYDVCAALASGRISKPLIAWCIGTCASSFSFEVQFGHAGACARGMGETARDKNAALAAAGAIVPRSFAEFGRKINEVYTLLLARGTIVEKPEPETPKVPMDYTWAKRLGMIRKPANFISTISDDRGEELKYCGKNISDIFSEDMGVGGVLSLLWFRKCLPPYATKFIEMILMVTADHGPAVSGAHNTIVTTRAGKDLVSSLVSGLLTIGPRFGGALDGAATMMTKACDKGISPKDFVNECKKNNELIMGIGHRIKSLENPDMRVVIIKEYAQKHFPKTPTLDFALGVEQVTTAKRSTLILNVDGCIAVCFVDLLRHCGAFTVEEADELIGNGCLNGLFVLGRSFGFIGHHLDQKRLKQPLYRHPWDDISYIGDQL